MAHFNKKVTSKSTAIVAVIWLLSLTISATGCSTLKALEPTAILITDIAKAL